MAAEALPPLETSPASTFVFVVTCLVVAAYFVALHARAYHAEVGGKRRTALLATGLGVWMLVSVLLAAGGVLATLAGSLRLGVYLLASNVAALALALLGPGRRVAEQVPIAALVAFQAFRLPLELVLHSWYESGVLPKQMTFEGGNFDILTGVLALWLGVLLQRGGLSAEVRFTLVALFNLIGFGLLVVVMSIAVRSAPWPLRTFMNDRPVTLPFHAPHTWIVPVCVAGALWGHVVVFRWLWRNLPRAESRAESEAQSKAQSKATAR